MKDNTSKIVLCCISIIGSSLFWVFSFVAIDSLEQKPKQINPYFWYEIGVIKANEQISKSKYLTEYEKRKLWQQIDSARKSDSINISKIIHEKFY